MAGRLRAASRTLRLLEIPNTIDKAALQAHLTGLKCQTAATSEIKGFSLGPHGEFQVATVSFEDMPMDFVECKSGHQLTHRLPLPPGQTSEIRIDCDFMGMTNLYHSPSNPEYDIIAVPGLSAHAFGSWKSPDSPHFMWLRDSLREYCPSSRIFTWGWESDLQNSSATLDITAFARRLLMSVACIRRDANRPLIFVCHSLGGVITKKALAEAAQENYLQAGKDILQSCVGLFLFGVPSHGLKEETIMAMVKDQKNEWFLNNLQENSEFLKLLHNDFIRTREKHLSPRGCEIVSFYELNDSPIVKVVCIQLSNFQTVLQTSNRKQKVSGGNFERNPASLIRMVAGHSATAATPDGQEWNMIGISCDHSHLVKFKGKSDPNFSVFTFRLQTLLENMVPPAVVLAVRAFYNTEHQISQLDATTVMELRRESSQFKSCIPVIFSGKECSKGIERLLADPDAKQWQNTGEKKTGHDLTLPDGLHTILTKLRDHVERYGDLAVAASAQGKPLPAKSSRPSGWQAAHRVLKKASQKCTRQRNLWTARLEPTTSTLHGIRNCTRELAFYDYYDLVSKTATRNDDIAAPNNRQQIRETSARLYQALTECTFRCPCHDCFFRLEASSFEGDPSQASIVFSLLIVSNSESSAPRSLKVLLDIVPDPTQTRGTARFSLCATKLQGMLDLALYQLDGFRVSGRQADSLEAPISRSSLKQLSESWMGERAKTIALGLRLGYAGINFHASPWLNLWNHTSVILFNTSESLQDSDGSIIHILGQFSRSNALASHCDLYMLAIMLVQLAGYPPFVPVDVGGMVIPTSKVDYKSMRSVLEGYGVAYHRLVIHLFSIGQNPDRDGSASDQELQTIEECLKNLREFAIRDKHGSATDTLWRSRLDMSFRERLPELGRSD